MILCLQEHKTAVAQYYYIEITQIYVHMYGKEGVIHDPSELTEAEKGF